MGGFGNTAKWCSNESAVITIKLQTLKCIILVTNKFFSFKELNYSYSNNYIFMNKHFSYSWRRRWGRILFHIYYSFWFSIEWYQNLFKMLFYIDCSLTLSTLDSENGLSQATLKMIWYMLMNSAVKLFIICSNTSEGWLSTKLTINFLWPFTIFLSCNIHLRVILIIFNPSLSSTLRSFEI